MNVDPASTYAFEVSADLGRWLAMHHAQKKELWVKIYKAASGITSVTWQDAIGEALAWGIRKGCDATSWLQRFTPRTRRSRWSQKNRVHAERLLAQHKIQPAGLAAILAAKADGRWDAAYAGSADMKFPDALLRAIAANKTAQVTFERLSRTALYPFFNRLQTVKRDTTRQAIMMSMLDRLSQGQPLSGFPMPL